MNAIDQQTRDYSLAMEGTEWVGGATFADYAYRNYGAPLEVSGDELARIRADLRDVGGPDCD